MTQLPDTLTIPNPMSLFDRAIRLGSHAVVSLGFLYGLFVSVPSLTESFRAEQKELRASFSQVLEQREQTFLAAVSLREDRMDARFDKLIAEQKSITSLLLEKAGLSRIPNHREAASPFD